MCEICHRDPCHAQCPNYEPNIIVHCEDCNAPIFDGDDFYMIGDIPLCEDCVRKAKRKA